MSFIPNVRENEMKECLLEEIIICFLLHYFWLQGNINKDEKQVGSSTILEVCGFKNISI